MDLSIAHFGFVSFRPFPNRLGPPNRTIGGTAVRKENFPLAAPLRPLDWNAPGGKKRLFFHICNRREHGTLRILNHREPADRWDLGGRNANFAA